MPTTDPIVVPIKGKDELSKVAQDAAKKSSAAMKELGGNLTQVGGTMTGLFTVPIAGTLDARPAEPRIAWRLPKAVTICPIIIVAGPTTAINPTTPITTF